MTGVREPLALVEILAALPVTIERAQVHVRTVALRDYGGDGRPSSTVTLGGADREGQGEHVGWTREVHEQFAASVRLRSWTWRGTVAQYLVQMDLFEPPDAPPYGRAAVESALLDLALKQAGTNLAAVAGAAPGPHPMRYVISFDAGPDPARRATALLTHTPDARFKIDVDPSWSDAEIAALARLEAVETLDWKGRGARRDVERVHAAFPDVLCEDPPCEVSARVARDQTILTAADARRAAADGAAINVKIPRMGGVLTALAALAEARHAGVLAYLGGMFEVGPGRQHARMLAALYTANAPNDLAPLPLDGLAPFAPSPLPITCGVYGLAADR